MNSEKMLALENFAKWLHNLDPLREHGLGRARTPRPEPVAGAWAWALGVTVWHCRDLTRLPKIPGRCHAQKDAPTPPDARAAGHRGRLSLVARRDAMRRRSAGDVERLDRQKGDGHGRPM